MRYLIITSMIMLSSNLFAQINLDSLWSMWNNENLRDSLRLEALGTIVKKGYAFSNPDSALFFSQMRYDYAESKGLLDQMGSALNANGVIHFVKGDYQEALDSFNEALQLHEQANLNEAIGHSLNNIAVIYMTTGLKTRALNYYQRSLKIQEAVGDAQGIANVTNNIGLIYNSQKDYEKALEYFLIAVSEQEAIGNLEGIANCSMNIGQAYRLQGNYSEALEFIQRALEVYKKTGNKIGEGNALNIMAKVYEAYKDYTTALNYYHEGLALLNEVGSTAGIAYAHEGIGNIHYLQGNYNKSIAECSKALEIAKEIGALELQKTTYECLYNSYKSLQDGIKALDYHERIMLLKDSLSSEETTKELERMEFEKEVIVDSLAQVEKTRLVQVAHNEEIRKKNQTRNALIGAGLLALLLAGGFYSRWKYVRRSKDIIEKAKDRSENLLLNILPAEIAEELKEKGEAQARDFDMVSILFTDFKAFTETSEKLSAADLVHEINACFKAFDEICEKRGIEKIKTIGDAYMAAGGLPVPTDDSVKNTILAALDMQKFISARKKEKDDQGEPAFEMRVGVHTGPVVAGIVGVKKFQYDIWGDTVNTASRIESKGKVGRVNISQATYQYIKDDPNFEFESRGKISAKGKGEMEMWFVKLKS